MKKQLFTVGNIPNLNILSVSRNGNVGIGTTRPTDKLAVNGNIRAREIKVETSNWPDYVFDENYSLKTLAETGAFIKLNKHLPDIPSAKEIESNGQNLGEMNARLLKKIEELTLHLIQKDEDIKQEKKINQTQEIRLNELEKKLNTLIKDK